MKHLKQYILLSTSAAIAVASSSDGEAGTGINNNLSSSRSSSSSSTTSFLSSNGSALNDKHQDEEHRQYDQHEQEEPQTIRSFSSNDNEDHDLNVRRDLREWEQSLNTINFMDGKYEYYNPTTYINDYISSEVELSSHGRRVAISGSNPSGDMFYALYDIGTRDSKTEWIYESVSGMTTSVLPGSSISLAADSDELVVGSNTCDYNSYLLGTMCVYIGEGGNNSPGAPEKGPMMELYNDDTSLALSWGKGVSMTNQGVYTAVGSSHGMVYVYNTPVMLTLKPGNGASLSLAKDGDPVVVDPSVVASASTSTFGEIVKFAGAESARTFAVGGKNSGRVAMYKYDDSTKKYTKLGDAITADGDAFAISDNGLIVAIKYRDSEVRVYELVTTTNTKKWSRLGTNTIVVDADKTPSLSISADGKMLAVGSYKGPSRNSSTKAGSVDLYEYDPSKKKWVSMAVPLVDPGGRSSNVDFGRSVSLSGDGATLAVAAPPYNSIFNKRAAGYVKVFNLSDPFPSAQPSKSPSPSATLYPSMIPSMKPSLAPSSSPSSVSCKDTNLRFKVNWKDRLITRNCIWIGNEDTVVRCSLPGVAEACPVTCNWCSTCSDTALRFKVFWNERLITRDCIWIGNRATKMRCNLPGVPEACSETCGFCPAR